jgi:pyrroloquinoline quinone biosynthesis protein D
MNGTADAVPGDDGGADKVGAGRPAPAMTDQPRIARGFRLQWEEVQDAWVLLYPEGMVKLNASAAEILRRCDGAHTVQAIIGELENAFETTGLGDDVAAFLEIATRQRWVEFAAAGDPA